MRRRIRLPRRRGTERRYSTRPGLEVEVKKAGKGWGVYVDGIYYDWFEFKNDALYQKRALEGEIRRDPSEFTRKAFIKMRARGRRNPQQRYLYGEAIQSFGDVNFIDYGGQLLIEGEDGDLFLEIIEEPEDEEDGTWTIYRTDIDKLKVVHKYGKDFLVDSKYKSDWPHPVSAYEEWFSKYIDEAASTMDIDPDELINMLCSNDPIDRAEAYIVLGSYFGWYEFDQYPLHLSREEVEKRYGE